MTNVPITNLPAATSLNSSDEVVIVQGGTTKRVPVSTFGDTLRNIAFANLPDPTTTPVGTRYFLTDPNTNTFYDVPTAPGPFSGVPIFSDGFVWRLG